MTDLDKQLSTLCISRRFPKHSASKIAKRSAKQYLDGLQKALSSLLQQKPGLEQGLEKQVLLLLDLLIGINQSLLTEVVETALF
ncbi:MAG: hypothetical protein AAFP20_24650, partial [Cyanobacteria bacterium J06614_10]